MKIAILGNYLPRQCGIATFTANLTNSILTSSIIEESDSEVFVVAMNDNNDGYDYPSIVKKTIRQQEKLDYDLAAQYINDSGADVCILQHEYGIFGGESGALVLDLLYQLKIPIVTTVHTVLRTPSYHERHIMKKIGELSSKVLVMSNLAIDFLATIYQVPLQKIEFIPHGVPDFTETRNHTPRFNYRGKKVLGTFGFLGRSKGIETVINALPKVIEEHPNVLYVVVGKTHPNVKKHSGEEYRNYLKQLAEINGVADNVVFEDNFLTEDDLKSFLVDLDVYVTPYLNEAQITSGTISYALGAGACILSTPFWHAKELLADGRGETFGFGDSEDLGQKLCYLLSNPQTITNTKEAAFEYGKKMYWNKIGKKYRETITDILTNPLLSFDDKKYEKILLLPKFSLDHIRRLTDDMGILEHANYSIPNYKEGYCIDDNARALLLVLMAHESGIDNSAIDLVDTYLRYIDLMRKENGFFHNDLGYDKKFLDETGSEDSFGRTIWAMAYLIRLAPNDSHFQFAKDVFFKSFVHFEEIKSIRAIAYLIIGICNFLKRFPDNETVIHTLDSLTSKLINQYKKESDNDNWKWFEPILSYDNAILPLSLWYSYDFNKNKEVFDVAVESTQFLDLKMFENGRMSLIGNKWYRKGEGNSLGGQQPIDAMAMVMMYGKAYKVTKDEFYYQRMHNSFSWFMGNNSLLIPLYDDESKGCCDGLELKSVNRNQGAESTISYLLSYLTIRTIKPNKKATSLPLERFAITNKIERKDRRKKRVAVF